MEIEGDGGADEAGLVGDDPELTASGAEVGAGVAEVLLAGVVEVEGEAELAVAAVDQSINLPLLGAPDWARREEAGC